jgi:hypothetical protein
LANFFQMPWTKPNRELRSANQVRCLSDAPFALTALGRLSDSIEPRRGGLDTYAASKDWPNAAIAGGELTSTLLALGRVAEAVGAAGQAVANANRSGDEEQRELRSTNLANALDVNLQEVVHSV